MTTISSGCSPNLCAMNLNSSTVFSSTMSITSKKEAMGSTSISLPGSFMLINPNFHPLDLQKVRKGNASAAKDSCSGSYSVLKKSKIIAVIVHLHKNTSVSRSFSVQPGHQLRLHLLNWEGTVQRVSFAAHWHEPHCPITELLLC